MGKIDYRVVVRRLGRRIADLRLARGYSQEEFAELARFSVRYLQSVEAGENLTVESLVRLANLLRVPVKGFFEPPTNGAKRRRRTARRRAGR